MTEDSALLKWAQVKRDLKDARKEVLSRHGLTEDTLKTLEENADSEMTSDEIELEVGTVVRNKKPIYLHKDSRQIGESTYLKLRRQA